MLKIIIIIIAFVIVLVLGLLFYSKHQMSKIPELSFQEALEYTTKDNEEATITVGIIKDGQMTYTVYGENGKELPKELHTYEIGSLTKTFTAAMIFLFVFGVFKGFYKFLDIQKFAFNTFSKLLYFFYGIFLVIFAPPFQKW